MPAQRIQRTRRRAWRMPASAVNVARPSLLGNPWIGADAVEAYRRFVQQVISGVFCRATVTAGLDVQLVFDRPLDGWKSLRSRLFKLRRDKPDVCCWCPPENRCHGDVLLELINRPKLIHLEPEA